MIKRLVALLPIALFAAIPASATVSLSIDAGLLTNSTGTPIADGDLILLIASPGGVFSPTVGSEFVSGDNLILGSSTAGVTGAFAMESGSSSVAGENIVGITFDLGVGATGDTTFSSTSIAPGDTLAIRWYDSFTLQDFENGLTPTTGDYGTYTTLLPPDGGAAWVVPADNTVATGNLGLFFFTESDGGSSPNIQGEALRPVLDSTAVPEPSTYALLAIGLVVFAGVAARRKRLALVAK